MLLDSTSKSIEILLGGTVTTYQLPVAVSYIDYSTSSATPGGSDTQTNNTTPVTIAAAPGASVQRKVTEIFVYNADTVDAVVTIQLNNGGTLRKQIKVTLSTGEALQYTSEKNWNVIQGTGAIKGSGGGGGAAWGSITGTLSAQTDLQTELNAKVTGNTAITGATKTKITYDVKGLVTAGADATTADIADSTDKRYCTDAQKTVISNTSGTNSGDASGHSGLALNNQALDTFGACTDITTLNASTSAHGLVVKPTAPAATLRNVVGIDNAETAYTNKALFDATVPSTETLGGSAATGSQMTAARRDHSHAITNPALDTLASPTDITTLNASTTAHGLAVKATAPASGLLNVMGIGNSETAYTNKAMFDTTNPVMDGVAAPGTQVIAARRDHVHPSDTSKESTANRGIANGYCELDASQYVPTTRLPGMSTTARGAVPATGTPSGKFLKDDGTFATATGSVADGDKGDITVSGSGTVWTIDNGTVTEAKQVLADNSTGNVSTSMHGYAPKVTDTSKYLKGDGTWATVTASTPDTLITKNVITANTTVTSGYSAYIPDYLEITSGFVLEIGIGSILEIG
jgi:hypothetical protein